MVDRERRRRVVITGIGLVTPVGIGTEESWRAIQAGASGVGPMTSFDASDYASRIAGEVKGFDAELYLPKKEVRRNDRYIHLGVAAATMAMEDSGLAVDESNSERVGVIIGSGIGGLPLIQRTHKIILEAGPRRISPFFIPGQLINMVAGHVSIRFGARGPNSSPCTACTTGLHAIGDAYRQIQFGYADAMIAGGAESGTCEVAVGGFAAMKALSTRNDEPEKASRPWDKDRDGFVMAEGSGILVLEDLALARRRGAKIYAEILGYGMGADAYHISAPHPEGLGAAQVMHAALADSGLEPERIAYINAHGTSTPLGDLGEVKAIKNVFGEHAYRLAVSSTKSQTGHLLGAAGAMETGVLALALRDQILPPTINLDAPGEGCDLDFVPHECRPTAFDIGLTNSFGFGGTNGSLILSRLAD